MLNNLFERKICCQFVKVPQMILDEAKENGRPCNIVVTQPRRIAARSIAQQVCHERNWELGQLVGYQVCIVFLLSF